MHLRIYLLLIFAIIFISGTSMLWPLATSMDRLIASYYFNGNVLDDLGSYDGSINGAEITTDRFSSTMSAYRFDGKEDHLNLGTDFTEGIDSLSVSIWIYPLTACEPSDTLSLDTEEDQYFLSSGAKGESTGVYGIWNQGAIQIGQNLSSRHSEEEYHAFLDDGQWHHIYLFFDSVTEEIEVYVNGVLAFNLDYVAGSSSTIIDELYIGGPNFGSGNGFRGNIDDAKFYDRKLNELEINDLYLENCPDELYFPELHIQSDTFLFAQTKIQIDSLSLDSSCNVAFITPRLQLKDSLYLHPNAQVKIQNTDACKHTESIHSEHFKHRGIYINNFVSDGILGNSIKEDSLIDWCIINDFNNAYLYNIGSALSGGMQEELDNFVEKANNQAIDITFVSAGHGTSFENIIDFHEDYDHIPQGIVSEIEFWNGSGDYDVDYVPWLDKMDSLKFMIPPGESVPLNPALKRRFYIGKIKNPGEIPSLTIAEDLIMHHDEIFLTNYHSDGFDLSSSTSENSIANKLSLLGKAARNLGREVDIVILFNVRQDSPAPNIWTYYSEENDDHDFRSGYEKWYHDFINTDEVNFKEYINLKGYGVYRWTDARVARGWDE